MRAAACVGASWLWRVVLTASLVLAPAVLVLAPEASADSATLSVVDASGKADPAQDVGRTFKFTVTASSATQFFVKYRPNGGAACAPAYSTDSGNGLIGYQGVPAGTQTVSLAETWSNNGPFLFCMWLGETGSTSTLVGQQVVTFRAPRGSISFAATPQPGPVNGPIRITVSGTSEAPRELFVTWRNAGGSGCAPTRGSDSGNSFISYQSVNGGFRFSQVQTFQSRGRYLFCVWLANSSDDTQPVAGPKGFVVTIGHFAAVKRAVHVRCTLSASSAKVGQAVRGHCSTSGASAGTPISIDYQTPGGLRGAVSGHVASGGQYDFTLRGTRRATFDLWAVVTETAHTRSARAHIGTLVIR